MERFSNVMLPARGGVFDILVEDGMIARIEPVSAPAAWVGLPPLVDLHIHASRAFTAGPTLAENFDQAVAEVIRQARTFTEKDYARQAERTFGHILTKGTTRARTHADVGGPFGMTALAGTLLARERFRDRMEVEVVAFLAPSDDAATPAGAALLRAAHSMGAGLFGAVPGHYPDPAATIDAILDLAAELGCDVDLHLDEHLDGARSASAHLGESVTARGLGGRVTLSHGCAIGALTPDARSRAIAALAEADICVVALPATNLYLQDRSLGTPVRRGLAPMRELISAGVAVRLASDNIRDVFNPYGSGDLLEVAALGAIAGHLENPRDLVVAICGGKSDLAVGDRGDFLLVRGASLAEILAERPTERRRIRAGSEA